MKITHRGAPRCLSVCVNISTKIDNCKVFRQKRLYRKKHNNTVQ